MEYQHLQKTALTSVAKDINIQAFEIRSGRVGLSLPFETKRVQPMHSLQHPILYYRCLFQFICWHYAGCFRLGISDCSKLLRPDRAARTPGQENYNRL